MAWAKLGAETLTSTADSLTTGTFTTNKFIHSLFHRITSGNTWGMTRFNSNSNNVYALRENSNGGADGTNVSDSVIWSNGAAADPETFVVQFILNISGKEKLVIQHTIDNQATGATNAPDRREVVAKFVPSPDADITEQNLVNTTTGDFATGTNLSALGSDLTPASGTSIETGSIYIDTDTNQRYFWNGSSWSLQA